MEHLRILWKRKALIALVFFAGAISTTFYSLSIENVYQSSAVITPISEKDRGAGGLSALAQQFGGLAGISLPGAASSSEIINLLKSNILREKMIKEHNLMPVIFHKAWDKEKGAWKKAEKGFSLNPLAMISGLIGRMREARDADQEDAKGVPKIWDGLRELQRVVRISNNIKENTIIISAEFTDPEVSANLVSHLLATLNNHMSSEAKRVAQTNRQYLEEQLYKTADPFIKQKIYNLIAQQLETSMMAEVKENFAFKVIDPPKVPDRKIRPRRPSMVMLGAILSGISGIALSIILERLAVSRQRGA